jgi:rfaE bifunctional protein nucleotidyltransferase chain/domain
MKPVVVRNIKRADSNAIGTLAGVGVSTAHEAFGRSGLMKPYMRPIWPGAQIAGPAVTVLAQPGDNWMIHVAVEQCQKGDVLVVGLNSDSSVKIIKGPDRPIHNQHDRAAVLAAFESVDFISVFDEPDPLKLIELVKPDVLVKGQDWEKKGVVGAEFVKARGGKVVLAPLVEGKSSTSVIEKMKSLIARKA